MTIIKGTLFLNLSVKTKAGENAENSASAISNRLSLSYFLCTRQSQLL